VCVENFQFLQDVINIGENSSNYALSIEIYYYYITLESKQF